MPGRTMAGPSTPSTEDVGVGDSAGPGSVPAVPGGDSVSAPPPGEQAVAARRRIAASGGRPGVPAFPETGEGARGESDPLLTYTGVAVVVGAGGSCSAASSRPVNWRSGRRGGQDGRDEVRRRADAQTFPFRFDTKGSSHPSIPVTRVCRYTSTALQGTETANLTLRTKKGRNDGRVSTTRESEHRWWGGGDPAGRGGPGV